MGVELVNPKMFSRKSYNARGCTNHSKESLQSIDIQKSENGMILQALPMAWGKRISYSRGTPESHECKKILMKHI
jgi:hypothetical protein